ncbi:MAG: family 20 glycosylhydrolase [Bacteroides sp]|nr:family 20 glycosylhydrolase [Bacteroides sp.]
MKKNLTTLFMALAIGFMTSCSTQSVSDKVYNQGINLIPAPVSLQQQQGEFTLTSGTTFQASTEESKAVANFFAKKLKTSTGFDLAVNDVMDESKGSIKLAINPDLDMNEEGYKLEVTSDNIFIVAKTPAGLFYGMQTVLQLLPAEIESKSVVKTDWTLPCVSIEDAPRFSYRGVHLDPCRHFMTVEETKRQLDVMAMLKINRMHWHLTEDQGWRIEIKKYPKLTEIGATRVEGEKTTHSGYYTQEEIKDVVAYAAERFITVVPELETPGHELSAIAAYPHLSCTGEEVTPRIVWGVEELVMCAGKEDMFEFLSDVVDEMVPLFPGTYFHIGGDESPKLHWSKCPKCQERIRKEGLRAKDGHTAEERLQSYVIGRMEKMLAKHGKKIIGWDEILEGGLSPEATVMSWRGEEGGIASALQSHDVIMTPGGNGMYLDHYQGDSKIEPVTIGGYTTLEKTYSYNPIPDTLVAMGKAHHILGVQGNTWSEYMYTNAQREYMMYPRVVAVAEIGWTPLEKKNYKDFERRINNAYVRLDGHGVNYHIPQPEQPNGSCNFVAFTDAVTIPFKSSRPIKMVYTIDGTDPTPASTEYTEPLNFTESTTLKIASVLPSGKMSPIRTITVEKQELAPAKEVKDPMNGLKMKMAYGYYLNSEELAKAEDWKEITIKTLRDIRSQEPTWENMRGVKYYGAIAEGYVEIPEDGVYYFTSNNDEVWIDGKLLIDNGGEVKRFSRKDKSVALSKGLHELKVVFCSHIIGGWPSAWDDASISIRKADQEKFTPIKPEQLFY